MSHPTPQQYANPKATGEFGHRGKPLQQPTDWTTDQVLADFEEFVHTAVDIADTLERCPPAKH